MLRTRERGDRRHPERSAAGRPETLRRRSPLRSTGPPAAARARSARRCGPESKRRASFAGQRDDRLGDVPAFARCQQLFVVHDRAEVVVAGDVGRGEDGRDSRTCEPPRRRRPKRCAHARAGSSRARRQLVAEARQVVEIERRARDVRRRALVRHGSADPRCGASESAGSSIGQQRPPRAGRALVSW